VNPAGKRIEVRLRELSQLFNSMDPSPFVDRDLDAAAEEFIVSWARELPPGEELELAVHLSSSGEAAKVAGTEEAVRHYFAVRAEMKGRELKQLLRRGRLSLVIGVLFLAVCFGLGEMTPKGPLSSWNEFVKLGLHIVGWVAMWRPLEIFLYDWWPVRSDRRLLERLARMRVQVITPPT